MGRKSPKSKRKIAAQSKRALKKKLHIFCEGAVTETLYFREMARFQREFVIDFVSTGKIPKTLFDEALAYLKLINKSRTGYSEHDQVWLIFDRDSHDHVSEVINNARSHGIHVAYSNPCFEVFLLYHFQDYDADEDRSRVKAKLAGICTEYCSKKCKLNSANEVVNLRADAIARSKRSLVSRANEGTEMGAPSSTAHLLIEALKLS
ncbi:RloB family protein [Hyphomonas johnsonii]|uniref:RloB family protein n=1 Tax=Hyphomonas johnsonii TaxID=81031 RepID=UPI003BB0CEEC